MGSFKSKQLFPFVEQVPVKIYLTKRADFSSLLVSISSDQKQPDDEILEMLQARNLLHEQAQKAGIRAVSFGLVSEALGKSAFSGKFRLFSESSIGAVELVAFLSSEKDEPYSSAAKLLSFLKSVTPPGKSQFNARQLRLGLEDPESYRESLLKMIADEMIFTQSILRTKQVKIAGLANAVTVGSHGGDQVHVYINYTMSMGNIGHTAAPNNSLMTK